MISVSWPNTRQTRSKIPRSWWRRILNMANSDRLRNRDIRAERPQAFTRRVESIDLLRGLLMLLMALDHTRDFFSSAIVDPTNPLHSWPALFLTRWVTHLCAPGFVALAGTSVFLQRHSGKPRPVLTTLLLTRGLWLIFLDTTIISFAWSFTFRAPYLQVIWAVGASMVILAGLQWLPTTVVASIGACIVLFHNLLDPIRTGTPYVNPAVWTLLYQPGFIKYQGKPVALVAYPLLPWIGVICLGYAFGVLTTKRAAVRQRMATFLGIACLTAFTWLRLAGGYGDDTHWHRLPTPVQTAMEFLVVEKYPPSLQYILATFGFLLLLYPLFDIAFEYDLVPQFRALVRTYGRVPFFYYVLHIYLIHAAALLLTYLRHGNWHLWINPRLIWFEEVPPGCGFSLPVVYGIWLALVLLLYFPCRWFSRFKGTHHFWWLSYV